MVKPVRFPFREHVRDEPIANVMCKRTKNVACFYLPPGSHSKTFQADHGVAPPIRKPVIARNDAADLVAGRARPGSVFPSAYWGKNKLVGGPDKLPAGIATHARVRLEQQPALAIMLRIPSLPGS